VVHVVFDTSSPETAPFPSDIFTVADDRQITGRRVNLSAPSDCVANASDCNEVTMINELDGFSTTPLLRIPFDGDIDPGSVNSDSVYLVFLGDASRRHIGINQVVWDPPSHMLHAQTEETLNEHARYALVVTNRVRDTAGKPVAPSEEFIRYRRQHPTSVGVPDNEIVAASKFTTRSTTFLYEKIVRFIESSPRPTADFRIGPDATLAFFPFDQIESITYNQQRGTTATLSATPIDLTGTRLAPAAIGSIAYGRFTSPEFVIHPGEYIPNVPSRTGTVMPRGSNSLYFTLYLPAGQIPPNGWPVIVFGHGAGGDKNRTSAEIAAIPASHGFAVIVINAVGHGGGPLSTVTLTMKSGTAKTVASPGRGFDQNGDGVIDAPEGDQALIPRESMGAAPLLLQTAADLRSLLRVLQGGVDANGDGRTDLDSTRIYYWSQSAGSMYGTPFIAYAEGIRASALFVTTSRLPELVRLSPIRRHLRGRSLETRKPPLLNSSNGIKSLDGVPVQPPFFNENLPLRNQRPVVNTVPEAMAIQRVLDRINWIQLSSAPLSFAQRLREDRRRRAGRGVLLWFARGDQSSPNPTNGEFVRASGLEESTVLYRHDLFNASHPGAITNPHNVLRSMDTVMLPIYKSAVELVAQFFMSGGTQVVVPSSKEYFEVGVRNFPEDLGYIR